ncbi:MFS transporter [Mesorhizobium sp. DCY119]|uniref:MFS transporter n=1 Tax=Mesorhizobium sp. DCY119 TaxID=2108445 RepID=UPI000E6C0F05|nr:MFS transporter [Mesorhizobium sp. DCY119]RJG46300.1 MFS transporter [Mesorhizobium sp. DCY119]
MTRKSVIQKTGSGAWGVVILGFLTLALAFTVRGSLSLAMPAWQSEFGWSRSFISGIAAASLLVIAVIAPFAGGLVDRRGSRPLLVFGLAAIGVGIVLVASAQPGLTSWLLPIGFAGIGALGFGTIAQHVVAAAIAQRIEQNRGLAVGIGTAGSTAGQLLLMPALAFLMQSGEWRLAFLLLAASCFLLIPVAWLTLGGHAPASTARSHIHGESGAHTKPRSNLAALARSPVFHALFWSYAICGFTTTGVIETHLMPYAALCGFSPVPSATAYGVLSALNLAGMIAAGWLSDRVHRPLLLAFIYTARAGAFILLMFVADSYPLLMVFATLFGLFDYSTAPVTASYLASRLGVRVLGLSMGLLAAGHAIGAAAGAWAGGAVFDWSGDYRLLWIASVSLAMVATLLMIGLSDDERSRGVKLANA